MPIHDLAAEHLHKTLLDGVHLDLLGLVHLLLVLEHGVELLQLKRVSYMKRRSLVLGNHMVQEDEIDLVAERNCLICAERLRDQVIHLTISRVMVCLYLV